MKKDIPDFKAGDTVKVSVKVPEAEGKFRIHDFEGVVIRRHGKSIKATFTVRKISFGEGVERTFPIHSPTIEKITVSRKGKARRNKLYYLRERIGKQATKVKAE
ncbi:MAG: 50S ribosomal protein L19 [Candidatus Omnitrophota bacterium]